MGNILDIIGNNMRTSSRRFFLAEMDVERQPSARFSLIPINSISVHLRTLALE